MLGPVVDTLLICTATASVILISGAWTEDGGQSGVTLTARAFELLLGPIGLVILFVCAICFAVTTILTYSFYGSQCAAFLFGTRYQYHYRWVYVSFIVLASVVSLNAAISIIDGAFAMMAIPTMLSALILAPRVKEAARIYFASLSDPAVIPPR
jgi:AGCS family alanine or glycine:cation symporter